MVNESNNTAHVHVRVSPTFKRALKMFCAREGTTEQEWIVDLLEAELSRLAPDLWRKKDQEKRKRKAGK